MEMMEKLKFIGVALAILILLSASPGIGLDTGRAWADDGDGWSNPHLVTTSVGRDGRQIDVVIIMGRPPEVKAPIATAPERRVVGVTNSLSDMPAFDWCYGCSATSAAMLCGWYDRNGYPNMYAGPTNGGLCPLTNATWGEGESPLSATHEGYDGLGTRGHVDDYWYSYLSQTDPYYGNREEHGYADCTADYMGTNQYHNWANVDGSTTFFYYTNGSPLDDYSGHEPTNRDGCHGLRLFVDSRGYTVDSNYNQYIYGYNGNTLGFTWAQYKAEIDADRPVLIHVTNHTMLGYGYNDTGSLVYLHDTWDHSEHEMTWGGTYTGGLQHYGVTVIRLGAGGPILPTVTNTGASDITSTSARLNGEVISTGGENPTVRICWGETDEGTTAVNWDTDLSLGTKGAGAFYTDVSGLDTETTTYYYRCYATNSGGEDWADSTQSLSGETILLDRQVSAGNDDCYRIKTPNNFSISDNYQRAGHWSEAECRAGGGMRFTNITIPKGTTITAASLKITAAFDYSGTTCRSRISAQDVDDAGDFSGDNAASFDTRFSNHTTARPQWTVPTFTKDTEYTSCEIKTVIQEIVNRAGWASGNDIAIFWEQFDDESTQGSSYAYRCGYSYEQSTTKCAKLRIEYSTDPPEPPVAPTVTNASGASSVTDSSATLNGEVTDNGGENPTVHIYWGETDGETTAENWDNHVDDLGTKGAEAFYEDISSLTSSTTYYYRCYATNSGGGAWAGSSESFVTLAEATTLDRQVSAGNDDCWRKLTTSHFDASDNYQRVGHWSDADRRSGGGMRFTNITIPKDATITAASLKITAAAGYTGTTCRSRISAQDVDDAGDFSGDNAASFDTRFSNHTTARPQWTVPTFAKDTEYTSCEIKTVIQEIVNRAGWTSGNDIVIFWEDFDDESTQGSSHAYRCGYAYEGSTTKCAKLHIEYSSEPPEAPDAPTPVSPGTAITFKWNASATATKYHLQVNNLANFTGTDLFNAELGDVTSQEVTGLSFGTTYYWRVMAGNDGGWSDWSSPTRSVLAN